MSDLKCNMKCFECIFRDCTQNTGANTRGKQGDIYMVARRGKVKETEGENG